MTPEGISACRPATIDTKPFLEANPGEVVDVRIPGEGTFKMKYEFQTTTVAVFSRQECVNCHGRQADRHAREFREFRWEFTLDANGRLWWGGRPVQIHKPDKIARKGTE